MSDRILLRVMGPDGSILLEDRAAELVGGLAVSHKHRLAFGRVQSVPFHRHLVEGEGPPQVGVACVIYLEDETRDLKVASRQYGPLWVDRIARYLVMGPIGSWVVLLSASIGLSFGFWPAVHAVSREGSDHGLAFLIAWSVFYVLVVARSITRVWHRQWAIAVVVGFSIYGLVFWIGKGDTYLIESSRDILDKIETWLKGT